MDTLTSQTSNVLDQIIHLPLPAKNLLLPQPSNHILVSGNYLFGCSGQKTMADTSVSSFYPSTTQHQIRAATTSEPVENPMCLDLHCSCTSPSYCHLPPGLSLNPPLRAACSALVLPLPRAILIIQLSDAFKMSAHILGAIGSQAKGMSQTAVLTDPPCPL